MLSCVSYTSFLPLIARWSQPAEALLRLARKEASARLKCLALVGHHRLRPLSFTTHEEAGHASRRFGYWLLEG